MPSFTKKEALKKSDGAEFSVLLFIYLLLTYFYLTFSKFVKSVLAEVSVNHEKYKISYCLAVATCSVFEYHKSDILLDWYLRLCSRLYILCNKVEQFRPIPHTYKSKK